MPLTQRGIGCNRFLSLSAITRLNLLVVIQPLNTTISCLMSRCSLHVD